MARRTKDQAEKTRDALLDAAEAVFYEQGVSRTSLEQIARAANVTRGAVYHHFRDKISLCEAMCQRIFLPQEDVLEQLTKSGSDKPLDDLERACCDSLKLMATDKRRQRVVSILMFRCEYVEDMSIIMERRRQCKDKMLGQCETMFNQAKKMNLLSAEWSPRLAAISLQSLMSGFLLNALEGRKGFDLAKSGPNGLKAFFRSVRS